MNKYVIKITRRLPEHMACDGGKGEVHFYRDRFGDEGKSYEISSTFDNAMRFTEQEVKKITEEIVSIYEEFEDISGKLLKIEVMDVETLKLVSMCGFNPEFEPEIEISRFDLMEL